MEIMKVYKRFLFFLALVCTAPFLHAQVSPIGDGSLGAYVVDSIVPYYNGSTTIYRYYERACGYRIWGYLHQDWYTRDTVLTDHFWSDDYMRDSIVELHLSIKQRSVESFEPFPECDSITFRQRTYYSSFNGAYSLVQEEGRYNTQGCDSVYNVNLVVRGHSTARVFPIPRCQQFYWPLKDSVYTASTTDTVRMMTQDGCDSLFILNLTVWYGDTVTDTQSVCDTYTWAGQTYTNSTIVQHHFQNIHTCDSLVTLDLTVRHSTSSTQPENVCDSIRWQGNVYTSTGVYRDTILNAVGCDSMMTLNLTVRRSSHDVFNPHACDNYTWVNHGWQQSYNATTTATHNYVNTAGCPSTDTLKLTVGYSNSYTDVHTACDSYNWIDGQTYTSTTNTPSVVLQNADQCDSTVTLDLTINHSTEFNDTLIACYAYTWRGQSRSTMGTYDLVDHITNMAGCDSTLRMHLSIINYNTDTTRVEACNTFSWHGKTYHASTVDTDTLVNRFGCDSMDVLVLTIHTDQTATDAHTVCDSLTWLDGNTYYADNHTAQYHTTTVHGCDSLITLALTVNYSNSGIETVEDCESYRWHGTTYTASTSTPTWHSTNVAGCDSVTTLHLTIYHADHTGTETASACDDYLWNGQHYGVSGHYQYHTQTVHGCDSTATLNLTIRLSNTGTDVQRVCDSLRWHGTLYTSTTSTPTYTETNAAGCDSVVTLHLTVNHSNAATDSYNVCDSLRWHGTLYTSSNNTATWHSTNRVGCDSTTTLNLIVRHSTVAVDTHSVCDRYTWLDGQTYTSDNHTALYPAGLNLAGCDSTVRLALTVRNSVTTTLPALSACDTYTWPTNGETYTVSGTYRDTLTNTALCDSIVTLPLTINYSFNTIDQQQACDTYTWNVADADGSNGHTYGPFTTTTTQVANQHTIEGCDSTVTLQLTIYYSDLTGSETLNVCDSVIWNGQRYSASGAYTFPSRTTHNCDSLTTLNLTVRNSTFVDLTEDQCDSYVWHGTPRTVAGRYTYTYPIPNAAGCDSTEVLTLTLRHSSQSSRTEDVCDSFYWDATGGIYAASGTHSAHLTNAVGCDSALTLHLTVRHSSQSVATVHACDNYSWNGHTYTADTNVDYHTTNAVGCDSIAHLHLTLDATLRVTDYVDSCQRCTWNGQVYYSNNTTATYTTLSSTGCDSITTLHLTIHQPGVYTAQQEACDSFYWAGTMYYLTAFPQHTFTDRWSCDSVVNMTLVIHHSDANTVDNRTECDSYTWPVNGQTYSSSVYGIHDTLQTVHQCDSVVTLNLTINNSSSSDHTVDVCDSYTWHGQSYTASREASYTHPHGNSVGCDSVEYLHLTVRHSSTSVRTENVCDSFVWDATGATYSSTGNYVHTLANANAVGCDSTLTLRLTVHYSTDSTLTPNVCDSYSWHGTTYTASTSSPRFDTLNAVGCDSSAYLHLTVRYSTSFVDVHDECDAYTWHGITYTASTDTPTYHTLNAAGCDSTATLHLTIRYSTSRTDTANRCDRYTWVTGDGNTYTTTTSVPSWQVAGGNSVGCDSIAHLDLIIRRSTTLDTAVIACDSFDFRGRHYTASTVYPEVIPNSVGCDSTITLYLTVDYTSVFNDIHDTCDRYTWTDGVTYTTSTTSPVQHLYTVVGHCDSTSHLRLTIRHSSAGVDLQTACDSFLWSHDNITYYSTTTTPAVHLTNSELCDSLVTLQLTVYHSDHIVDTYDICDSLVWHGVSYTSSNSSAQWNGLNVEGCDSVVTLNLTVRYSTAGIDEQDVCDSLRWLDGNLYTADNYIAQTTIPNMVGCDSLVTLNLHVRYNSNTSYSVSECDMYVWPRNNYAYNRSQTAYYSYVNAEGCGSVDTLYLTINPSSHMVFNQTVCDTFTWNCHDSHMLLDTTGTYFHNYTNEYGCPSADTLHLNVNHNTSTAFTVDECDRYTWNNHGWDTTVTTSGTYLHDYATAAGCASTDTLYLTVRYSTHLVTSETVCDSFHWECHDHQQEYYTSGTYHHDYTNAAGCPSADTLHLIVNENTSAAFAVRACDSYTWYNHGDTMGFDSTGTYVNSYLTAEGCASADTLYLTIHRNSNRAFSIDTCDKYTWMNHGTTATYTVGGAYYNHYSTSAGCPSVDTLYLTLRYNSNTAFAERACDSYTWLNHGDSYTFSTSGTYVNNYVSVSGCPSTDTLYLTVAYNSDSVYHVAACDSYRWPSDSITYTFSTIQEHVYTNAVGCSTKDSLYLTIYRSTSTAYSDTACDMYVWRLNGNRAYNRSGTYYRHYQNVDSVCWNVDTLRLVVYYNSSSLVSATACDTFRWINHDLDTTLVTTGEYLNGYVTDEGCASTDTLSLTVNYKSDTAYSYDVCDSFVWRNHDVDTTLLYSGTYLSSYLTSAGCPSTDTLYLTVRYNSNGATDTSVCESYVWHDSTYTITTNTTVGYVNGAGCPSVDTLRLVVRYNSDSVYTVQACEAYWWPSDSITYTFSTMQTHEYINGAGCASSDTLKLTVYRRTDSAYRDTACDEYVWRLNGDSAYHAGGTYYRHYQNGDSVCWNVDTLFLTVYYNSSERLDTAVCDTFRWVNHGLDTLCAASATLLHPYRTAEGCASVDTLRLTVHYNSSAAFVQDVCDGYTWMNHDSVHRYTSSGVYENAYFTEAGCASVDTLYLTVRYSSSMTTDTAVCDSIRWYYNASLSRCYRVTGDYIYDYINDAGCPSTDTLHLVVHHNTDSFTYARACERYYWYRDSITYTFGGVFYAEYLTPEGCLSHDTLSLIIDRRRDSIYYDTACDYYTWLRNRTAYNHTGVYSYGPYTVAGNICQNYDTLYLKIYHADYSGAEADTACDTFEWHGRQYTHSGSYRYDTLTVHGCDSAVTLNLTLYYRTDTTYTVPHACDSYQWDRDSIVLTFDTSGYYYHDYLNAFGCPSRDYLELRVYYNSDSVVVDTACDTYRWHDSVYTNSTVDTFRYMNGDNCPSVDTLYLTVYASPRGTETLRACDSLVWRDGVTYYASTTLPVDTTASEFWCDSLIALDLTVNYTVRVDSVGYFCDSSNFIFHDSVIYTPGVYRYVDVSSEQCDSIVNLELIQLPHPILTLEESHSCETYEYTLTVHTHDSLHVPCNYTWYSTPSDLTLVGQENDSTVIVHPVSNTAYTVLVDYQVLPTCAATLTSDTLLPIVQPHAVIKTTPPFVQAGDVEFRVEDKSYDYTRREWYVNGVYWGDEKSFNYSAPASHDDSVALMLVSISPTCTDTAYLLVPIHNFTLYIPNVFTPTEPSNQLFRIFAKSVGQFEMWIYTREGLLVYHTTDINEGWDGRYHGTLCQQAAYVYHIRYTYVVSPEAWHTATGTVTLLR